MSFERRHFLKTVGAGALAATVQPSFNLGEQAPQEQKVHHDFRTNNPGVEYFCLGNGQILAALQVSPKPEEGTHCGLLVMSAEHFARKMSTYLFHPERGLQNTRFTVIINERGYLPEYRTSAVRWKYPGGIPTVVIQWQAAGCTIREELMCPINDSALVRRVSIENTTSATVRASGTILLYPNLMLFDEYHVDRVRMKLTASGYQTLELFSLNEATVGDRHMNIQFGEIGAGEKKSATVVLTLNLPRSAFEKKGLPKMVEETEQYWKKRAQLVVDNEGLTHLFGCAKTGLRAAVGRSGKMDEPSLATTLRSGGTGGGG